MGRVADELMKKETNQSTDTAQQGANAVGFISYERI